MVTQATKTSPLIPSAKAAGLTPMMTQFLEIKADYDHALLFYRMGDFYEMFFHDAEVAAAALNLTLTKRGQFEGKDIPMCGVPVHAMDNYLSRLIKQGFKVAICEQSEDPESFKKRGGKGPLPRAVVRLVTAGTLNEEGLLAPDQHNFLAALGQAGGEMALAWADMSTSIFQVQAVSRDNLESRLSRLQPSEMIWPQSTDDASLSLFLDAQSITSSPSTDDIFDSLAAQTILKEIFQDKTPDLSAFSRAMLSAAGALLSYLKKTQISTMPRLSPPQIVQDSGIMEIDPATRRSLELTRSMTNERKGSLLAAIDKTSSAAGARLLSQRLSAPLTDCQEINHRLDLAQLFVDCDDLRKDLKEVIKKLPDSERSLARLTIGRGGPRDLLSLRSSFAHGRDVNLHLMRFMNSPRAASYDENFISELSELVAIISHPLSLHEPLLSALVDEVPLLARDGDFVKAGFDPRLDELRALRDESRRLIAALQADYINRTDISSLKIKHNNVLGYHIDVRANYADKMMNDEEFIHRQTTAQTMRFTTTKLAELERDISSAGEKSLALELDIFADLVRQITDKADEISAAGDALAQLDVAIGTSLLSVMSHYCRPSLRHDKTFAITAGRHPVVEQSLSADSAFMANDCHMAKTQSLWLLTGPNMAGKSTFLRQNALIAILAQAGIFVPAESADIGIIDKCFSRVGASDDLARGQSTFMVEMVETATILNQATDRSLVILDEIGRGTATFDGLAIAHACLEYLHDHNQCRTLFATHYHELIALEDRLANLYPCTMQVKEWQNDIVFLHKVGAGAASRSYGVHVAKLAGLPADVVSRAEAILTLLETDNFEGPAKQKTTSQLAHLPLFSDSVAQASARDDKALPHPAVRMLQSTKPDDLTARQALDLLYELAALVDDEAPDN